MKIELEVVENGMMILLNEGEFYASWVWLMAAIYFAVFILTWRIVAQFSGPKSSEEPVAFGFVAAMLWPVILIVGAVLLTIRHTIFLGYPRTKKEQS